MKRIIKGLDAAESESESEPDDDKKVETGNADIRNAMPNNELLAEALGDRVGLLCESSDGELERMVEKALLKFVVSGHGIDKLEADVQQAREKLCAMEEAVIQSRRELKEMESTAKRVRHEMANDMMELNLWMVTRFGRLRVRSIFFREFIYF